MVAVKDASKVELSATYVTTSTVSIPKIGTAHEFSDMPEVEFFAVPDAINEIVSTGSWTLTNITNPVVYDQVSRCTATFTKWRGMKR